VSRPATRKGLPERRDARRPRKLDANPALSSVAARFAGIQYEGSPKHKRHPHLFGLEPFRGERGDETLCDELAGWKPADTARVPALFDRAKRASLVGSLLWTVDDNGWIYELQMTNAGHNQHHGYPVLPTDPFALLLVRRFAVWAGGHGTRADKQAAENCKLLYDAG